MNECSHGYVPFLGLAQDASWVRETELMAVGSASAILTGLAVIPCEPVACQHCMGLTVVPPTSFLY